MDLLGHFLRKFSRRSQATLLFLLLSISALFSAQAASPHLITLKPGVLTIGTYFTNPPMEYLKDGRQVGFEVDLIEEIAQRLKLKPTFINTQWETILGELKKNKYDIIMGAITITAEREKTLAFSQPFMTTTLSIIINEKKTPQVKNITDLHDQSIGVQKATTDYDIAVIMQKKGTVKTVKVYPFAHFNFAIDDLIAGKVGSVMKVFPVAYYYVQIHPELKILAPVPNDPQPLGFGFNKNNPGLVAAVNKVQAELIADGTYQRIYQKWFK